MTSSVPLTRLSARTAVATRGAMPSVAEAVPTGCEGCLLTKPVNGGASAFGLFFYICAKEQHPILVNELRKAALAGLNFGAGKPVGVQASVCSSGTARGEDDDQVGGKDRDVEVGGAPRYSYSICQVTDEDPCVELFCGYTACSASLDLPLVSAPIPAAFVGAISYTRMS